MQHCCKYVYMFFSSYSDWKHCIEVKCGIELTADYIDERLRIWNDETKEETKKFIELYGDAYHRQIVSFFEQAKQERHLK